MNELFQNALNSLKSKPAEFTIIALMIIFGWISIPLIKDENMRFWIFLTTILLVTMILALIIVRQKNNLNEPITKKNLATLPLKLIEILTHLEKIDYYHKRIEYKITLKEIIDNHVWVLFEFEQTTLNCLNSRIDKLYQFPFFSRKTKVPKAEINGVEYLFEGKENAKNQNGYQIEAILEPNAETTLKFSVFVEYNSSDSELLATYRYCDSLYFHFYDEISDTLNNNQFSIICHPMHSYKGTDCQLEKSSENNYKKKIAIKNGLLPYQGIYLKWIKNEKQ